MFGRDANNESPKQPQTQRTKNHMNRWDHRCMSRLRYKYCFITTFNLWNTLLILAYSLAILLRIPQRWQSDFPVDYFWKIDVITTKKFTDAVVPLKTFLQFAHAILSPLFRPLPQKHRAPLPHHFHYYYLLLPCWKSKRDSTKHHYFFC